MATWHETIGLAFPTIWLAQEGDIGGAFSHTSSPVVIVGMQNGEVDVRVLWEIESTGIFL